MILAKGEILEYLKHFFKNKTIIGEHSWCNIKLLCQHNTRIQIIKVHDYMRADFIVHEMLNIETINTSLNLQICQHEINIGSREYFNTMFTDQGSPSLSQEQHSKAVESITEIFNNCDILKEMMHEDVRKGLTFIRRLK